MINLQLDWREVLWWMQGGMAGSHLRWSVYEDMVNKVWPQCTEQERRNIWLIMRRDLGTYWRPKEWNGFSLADAHGEGDWKPENEIFDKTPFEYFRQVLARFDPENQYAVTMPVHNNEELSSVLRLVSLESIISEPSLCHFRKDEEWQSDTATVTVRTYKWQDEYRIDWQHRCDESKITNIEQIAIKDDGTM